MTLCVCVSSLFLLQVACTFAVNSSGALHEVHLVVVVIINNSGSLEVTPSAVSPSLW